MSEQHCGSFLPISPLRRQATPKVLANSFPRYNGAPQQDYPIIVREIVREPDIMGPVFATARWASFQVGQLSLIFNFFSQYYAAKLSVEILFRKLGHRCC
jgi:hypothetical protein